MELTAIHEKLRRAVGQRRYDHAVRTAQTAQALAERFGLDAGKAYLAGLLHDCAKNPEYDDATLLALAEESGYAVSPIQREHPYVLLHAQAGAALARREYGVTDPETLQAIARHQAGAVPMTKLDKAVSLADAIEPGRKDKEAIRNMAKADLDEAFFLSFVHAKKSVMDRGLLLEENTTEVYNALVRERDANRMTTQ